MNKEIKAAKRFVKISLKGNINFEAVSNYINKTGYTINFYNPGETNSLIEKYKLSDFSKSVHAFTVKTKDIKTVFIDISLSAENKMRALLHEAGHIVLGHMDVSSTIADRRLHDMQAEAFAYAVLTYKRSYKPLYFAICLVLTSVISATAGYNLHSGTAPQPEQYNVPAANNITQQSEPTEIPTQIISENNMELVYVTKSGTHYHKADCRYIKNNNTATSIKADEADKRYTPCKVCNPK